MSDQEREAEVRQYRKGFALCSRCDRDATQVLMSWCCVDMIEDRPFRCDECREQIKETSGAQNPI